MKYVAGSFYKVSKRVTLLIGEVLKLKYPVLLYISNLNTPGNLLAPFRISRKSYTFEMSNAVYYLDFLISLSRNYFHTDAGKAKIIKRHFSRQ